MGRRPLRPDTHILLRYEKRKVRHGYIAERRVYSTFQVAKKRVIALNLWADTVDLDDSQLDRVIIVNLKGHIVYQQGSGHPCNARTAARAALKWYTNAAAKIVSSRSAKRRRRLQARRSTRSQDIHV